MKEHFGLTLSAALAALCLIQFPVDAQITAPLRYANLNVYRYGACGIAWFSSTGTFIEVRNTGVAASKPTTVRVLFYTQSQIGSLPALPLIQELALPAIAAGGYVRVPVTLPVSASKPSYRIILDPNKLVVESNESDNVIEATGVTYVE